MKPLPILTHICCAAGLVAACAMASAQVNRCVDKSGHVLFTDTSCVEARSWDKPKDGAKDAIRLSTEAPQQLSTAANSEEVSESGSAIYSSPAAVAVPVVAAPSSLWASLQRPVRHRSLSLDATTLQSAHAAMLEQDEAHHSQRLASLR